MAKKNESRIRVNLKCSECGTINYRNQKNVKNTTEKLTLNKYCPKCKKHTNHKESK